MREAATPRTGGGGDGVGVAAKGHLGGVHRVSRGSAVSGSMLPSKKMKGAPNATHGGTPRASSQAFVAALLTTDVAHGCHRARPFQFALGRKVPFSNAPIVRLHERGAGVFSQHEEFLRRFQHTPKPAQWVNHWCAPLGTFSTVPRLKKRLRDDGVLGMLWVICFPVRVCAVGHYSGWRSLGVS